MTQITDIEQFEDGVYIVRGHVENSLPLYTDVKVTLVCDGDSDQVVSYGALRREFDGGSVVSPEFVDAAKLAVWAYRLGRASIA